MGGIGRGDGREREGGGVDLFFYLFYTSYSVFVYFVFFYFVFGTLALRHMKVSFCIKNLYALKEKEKGKENM